MPWTVSIVRNQTFAKAMFAYGCFTTALVSYIYFSFAVLRRPEVPEFFVSSGSAEMWVYIVGGHVSTFIVTLASSPTRDWDPLWDPVIQPTKRSILVGRTILIVAALNFLYWPLHFLLALSGLDPLAPWRAVAAMLLLSTTYTAVHWALRPENIFSRHALLFLRRPLGSLTDPLTDPVVRMAAARRPAMPLEEWIPELLRCCERAVESKRLVNSETPGKGEIDGLQFQVRVLDELGSKTCVLRYKKRLSRDGFRAIQEFLRRVASLDRKQPNQGAWQEIMEAARSVLAVKGTLVRENARATKGRFSN